MTDLPTINLASPEFKANPHPFYARLRAEAPVYRTLLPDKQSAWLITRYDDAHTCRVVWRTSDRMGVSFQ